MPGEADVPNLSFMKLEVVEVIIPGRVDLSAPNSITRPSNEVHSSVRAGGPLLNNQIGFIEEVEVSVLRG